MPDDMILRAGLDATNALNGINALEGRIKNFGLIAGGVFLGLAVLKGAFDWMLESTKQSLEAERAFKLLEGSVRATGGAANLTAKEISAFNEQLQLTTNFDADEINRKVSSVLLTFRKISDINFKRAEEQILNISTVMGTDLQSATVMVGKALNDPIQGMTSLRRVGIQLTQTQQEQVKQFMAVNDVVSAQKVILSELENQFGGQAQNMVEPAKQLASAWGDVREQIGVPEVYRSVAKSLYDLTLRIRELQGASIEHKISMEEAVKTAVKLNQAQINLFQRQLAFGLMLTHNQKRMANDAIMSLMQTNAQLTDMVANSKIAQDQFAKNRAKADADEQKRMASMKSAEEQQKKLADLEKLANEQMLPYTQRMNREREKTKMLMREEREEADKLTKAYLERKKAFDNLTINDPMEGASKREILNLDEVDRKVKNLQDTYAEYGNMVADVFNVGLDASGKFFMDIESGFKNLIAQLVKEILKNAIIFSIFSLFGISMKGGKMFSGVTAGLFSGNKSFSGNNNSVNNDNGLTSAIQSLNNRLSTFAQPQQPIVFAPQLAMSARGISWVADNGKAQRTSWQ